MTEFSKDVMIALLGAAIALAGLLLVVSGFVLTQVNTFPAETTDDRTLARYELAAKLGIVPFLFALADACICLTWLIHKSDLIYACGVGGFFFLLLLTAVYGSVLLLKFL